MKKLLSIGLIAFLLVGCSQAASSTTTKDLTIGGSTSMQPLMEQVAESYKKTGLGEIAIQGGGSSVGIKGAISKTFDLGMSSRALKEEEAKELESVEVALDGIVLIVNKDNPINNLTLTQAKDIYTGKITNWKELDGEDAAIEIISREEGSGTRDGFESIVGFKSEELVSTASVQNATGAVTTSVNGNKNAIGYISFGSLGTDVKALSINDAVASEATIADKSYKLQRPFLLVYPKGGDAPQALLDYIYSTEGQTVIKDHKYVPVPKK